MGEAGRASVLLTFHGTLLCYDRRRAALCQCPLTELDPAFSQLALDQAHHLGILAASADAEIDGPRAALAGLAPGDGLYAGSLSLSRLGLYLSAASGGGVAFVNQCLGWESLLPLPVALLALLRHIMASAWRLPGLDANTPARPRLGRRFTLHLGEFEVDLLQAPPVAADGAADRIAFTPRPPGSAAITAERVRPTGRAAVVSPKIWIQPLGNTANRALQYLTAEALRAELPEAVIENLHLPEWGRVSPHQRPSAATATHTGTDRYRIDLPGLADCLRGGVVEAIILDGFTYNLDQYPPRATAKRLLGETVAGREARGFGSRELVCSVRAGEILRGIHADYLPLPPGYYRLLAERSGLDLVFFGQLGDDAYTQSLRDAFPKARFIPGRDPGFDFDTLRRSAHLAPSISTFAWLAAWLGEAETIYLPVGGMFNPVQHPDQTYLPIDDPAYRFVLLPYAKMFDAMADPARFARQQALLGEQTRFVEAAEIATLLARAEPLGRGRVLVGGFDPQFYTARNRDVAATLSEQSALTHYLHHGAAEGRLPCAFDADFYVEHHPEAAMEIAAGLHPTPLSHYMAAGWRRGYAPTARAM